jgi:Rrf2 family protein
MAIIRRETDYALRALARLAGQERHLPVSALAQQEDVPEKFLRKIMQRLHRAQIVESRQGPFGGYRMAVPAERLSALDVVNAVQGPVIVNECFAQPDVCKRVDWCPFRRRLVAFQSELNALLGNVHISEVGAEMAAAQDAPTSSW